MSGSGGESCRGVSGLMFLAICMTAHMALAQNVETQDEQIASDPVTTVMQKLMENQQQLMENQRRLEERLDTLAVTRVETGWISLVSNQTAENCRGRSCWPDDGFRITTSETDRGVGPRGIRSGRVTFARPFSTAPTVLVALSQLDFDHGQPVRIRGIVTTVDQHGFEYDVHTWAGAIMYGAGVSWVAAGK